MVDSRGKFIQAGAGLKPTGAYRRLKGIRAYRMMNMIHFESVVRGGGFSGSGPLQLAL